jgi:very-short-patch-repair endonuclease
MFSRDIQAQLFGDGKRKKVNAGEQNFLAQCIRYRLPKVEPQHQFAKAMGRKFSADFAFIEYQLLVEIQGGVWRPGGGAHSHPSNIDRDIEKQQYAALLGFHVLPFTPQQVKSKYAIDWTSRVLYKLGWRPT